ncbi:MAG: tRNA (N6-threonylcarbamoyladenosine(37)-N6)-methyltransferase TrmO [Hyphomicrobiales bacterium]|nr:tRNA (N6-threonylcarbamoyladenosine(37)-N6)-methyltransferase TrmO [Hyphomicrobiales bacterium]
MTIKPRLAPTDDLRPGEVALGVEPAAGSASLFFIGRIFTPWATRGECPRRGDLAGPLCRVDIAEPWREALFGIETCERLQLLYWMHLSRRDLVLQNPRHGDRIHGTFALRSPVRPNPIASSIVVLERVEGSRLFVRGLDCVDGTPLLDIKPEHCPRA